MSFLDRFKKVDLGPGITLYFLPSGKFKTTTVNVYLHLFLKPETVTRAALLPKILERGTRSHPTSLALARHLESLYGAKIETEVVKKGEYQLLGFSLEIPNGKFLPGWPNLFAQGLEALAGVINAPAMEGEGFVASFLDQEKTNLRRKIEGLINDKRAYASARCFQEMCREEPFGLFKYGRVDDIDPIDGPGLYSFYRDLLATSPISVYVIGDLSLEAVEGEVRRALDAGRRQVTKMPPMEIRRPVRAVKTVEEKQDVNQGKLCLGLRTQTGRGNPDFFSLVVANGVLGGYAHSKLFQNVREKASLAYYAYSSLEVSKGLMLISSGIEFANYEKTLEIIREQLAEVANGQIKPEELEAAKKSLTLEIRTNEDQPLNKILSHLNLVVNGLEETPEEQIDRIQAVTVEEAARAAARVELDTVYFLTRQGVV